MTVKVLVAYGSKFGSTAEIAQAIGAELRLQGMDVTVQPADGVPTLNPYQVVLVGSAIYAGRWRRPALRLLRRESDALRARRVWLFQSGLSVAGPGPKEDPTPDAVRELATEIGAALPVSFAGALLRSTARGLVPRLMARGAAAGDHRDWEAIRAWAREVAAAIDADADRPAAGGSRR